jgi:hypothetical protein
MLGKGSPKPTSTRCRRIEANRAPFLSLRSLKQCRCSCRFCVPVFVLLLIPKPDGCCSGWWWGQLWRYKYHADAGLLILSRTIHPCCQCCDTTKYFSNKCLSAHMLVYKSVANKYTYCSCSTFPSAWLTLAVIAVWALQRSPRKARSSW